ncbi:MAG: Rieske 2Fe-2S domain-containing protein [Thermoanaerobaculia bacterium]|nr:Rieske 2Fe-2S domain-containing protein [Thermoanaerobaculia bacterium]
MADDKLEELLRVLEMYSYDDGRNRIVEALGAVLDLHRDAFARTLAIAGASDPGLVERLRRDPVVAGILEGYGLIETDVARQVESALERLRPLLEKDRTAAKLMEVSSGSVRIHFVRPLDAEVSLERLVSEVEKSLKDDLPDHSVTVTSSVNMAYAEKRRNWLPLVHRFELEDEELRRIQMFDDSVLACDVGGEVYAFRDRCPSGGLAPEGWRREGRVITCPCHGHRFDLSDGHCVDRPELALELLPVRLDDTAVLVGL